MSGERLRGNEGGRTGKRKDGIGRKYFFFWGGGGLG